MTAICKRETTLQKFKKKLYKGHHSCWYTDIYFYYRLLAVQFGSI